jgi:glycosyltransferase involved in cell wall biosynthesis
MATIGIVTVAMADLYRRFLPEWAASVAALNRQPDVVCIVADEMDDDLWTEILGLLPQAQLVRSKNEWQHHAQVLANDAIAHMETDWVCRLDADDLILPHAFDRLDGVTADVYSFGISINNERDHSSIAVSTSTVRNSPNNHLYSASPFRRSVWVANGGFVDAVYQDWIFWRQAAAHGAEFEASATVDYIWRSHDAQVSAHCDDEAERRRVLEWEINT